MPVACSSDQVDAVKCLEQSWKKRRLSWHSDYEMRTEWWSQSQRPACSTQRHRRVKQGKKAICFTLLKRITNIKVYIRPSVQSSLTQKWVSSRGAVAPCRRHHGKHTWYKVDRFGDPWGHESQPTTLDTKDICIYIYFFLTRWDKTVYIYIYNHRRQWRYKATAIKIYRDHQLWPQLNGYAIQVRHAGTFARDPVGVFVGHRPTGPPMAPRNIYKKVYNGI